MKKILASILLVTILFGASFFSFNLNNRYYFPQRAYALFGLGDIVFDPTSFQQLILQVKQGYEQIKGLYDLYQNGQEIFGAAVKGILGEYGLGDIGSVPIIGDFVNGLGLGDLLKDNYGNKIGLGGILGGQGLGGVFDAGDTMSSLLGKIGLDIPTGIYDNLKNIGVLNPSGILQNVLGGGDPCAKPSGNDKNGTWNGKYIDNGGKPADQFTGGYIDNGGRSTIPNQNFDGRYVDNGGKPSDSGGTSSVPEIFGVSDVRKGVKAANDCKGGILNIDGIVDDLRDVLKRKLGVTIDNNTIKDLASKGMLNVDRLKKLIDPKAQAPGFLANPGSPPCGSLSEDSSKCLSIATSLPNGKDNTGLKISTTPSQFIITLFTDLLGIIGGIAILLIISAGYKIMMSSGKPEAIQQAREQLVAAIVGLIFIILSFVIFQLIVVDVLKIPGICRDAKDPNCLTKQQKGNQVPGIPNDNTPGKPRSGVPAILQQGGGTKRCIPQNGCDRNTWKLITDPVKGPGNTCWDNPATAEIECYN